MRKEVNGKHSFVYSDLGILVLQKVVERITNQPLDEFLSQNFYEPLGMMTTTYSPLGRFPESQIAPTENDFSYRNPLLRGTVHDQMAAVYGGVAGHAGLFLSLIHSEMCIRDRRHRRRAEASRFFRLRLQSNAQRYRRLRARAQCGEARLRRSGGNATHRDRRGIRR